ncbi:16769_t:CDS:10 [Funneliformis mosseae]|uniref:16769_t:CDS:1 n=2 Tax=Funneliformis TaxID=1117308 RepID=A0A9N8YRX1_FUNMO|nr:16769_t:CDS:10 [Funneliformis mosseae]
MASFKNIPPNFTISPDGSHLILSIPIEKSYVDDRSYRLIRLSNELEILLIHDAETDKSSAALDIHVGHLCDPDNLQGLAHFCEHLLFMGTEKYPKENEYREYVLNHGGYANAYTSSDNTNYYFEVGTEFLEGALDRFSQFFIKPLFDPSCTDREICAVDSENKKNLQSDHRRIHQLERSLSDPKHPYSKFGTGNLKTLKEDPIKQGLNIRDELLKFHDQYYSANIMKLVVLGRESLDQLSQWVVKKFSAIINKSIPVPTFEGHPFTESGLSKQVFIKSVKDIRMLKLLFPFPDLKQLFRVNPVKYLSYLIGHEGVGSILSLLKRKGLANNLISGLNYEGVGFAIFEISIELTKFGLDNYEDVVVHIFQYIEMLRKIKELEDISFRFEEKSSPSRYSSTLSNMMQNPYPREWILSGPYLIREYNPLLISELLDLLRPDNFFLELISQSFTGLDQKEKWYGTEYKVEPLGDKLTQALINVSLHPDLKMPLINEFIPTNFETHKTEFATPANKPNLIKNTPLCRLWHKKDDTFWIPKASVNIKLKSPLVYITPSHCVKAKLFTDLVCDTLTEDSYSAEVAGVTYYFNSDSEGLLLVIDGFNDKLQVLLEKIVIKIKNFQADPERFLLMKERRQRSYKNSLLIEPYQQSMYYMKYLTQDKAWTNEEKLEALQDIKYEDIKTFYSELLNKLYIESLIHGNIFKDDAIKIIERVEEILQPKALIPSQLIGHRNVIIPQGKRFIYQRSVINLEEYNSAIYYYIQIGDLMDKELRAKSSILAQIANEPCFDQLRTKEQLGYIVESSLREQISSVGFRILIQSEKDTIHLENRIEAFLGKLLNIIEEISEQEYQKQVHSLIIDTIEKPKNLFEETGRYWDHIISGYYNFEQIETDVEELRKITKQELLEFYKKFIIPTSPFYKKLSVHIRTSQSDGFVKRSVDINHLNTYLLSQGLTTITINVLQKFFGTQTKLELDKCGLENLSAFLTDQTKVDKNEIEGLINNMYLNGVISTLEKVNERKDEKQNGEGELELELKDENVIIDDIVLWKSNVELGPTATPVIPLHNSISKL